jgi:hypothetical protein
VSTRLLGLLPFRSRRTVLHAFGRFAPWEPGFDFTPPSLGHGERAGPPDFVGIGAQKAGTTWWHALVEAHPGVTNRPDIHKERHFFSRFATQSFSEDEVVCYRGWFPRTAGKIAGEWTPDYLTYPWVAPLLHTAAPDTKLIVILRDPVERFTSGLVHSLANGGQLTSETVSEAVNRGFYGLHLERWAAHFDDSSMLILQYELCVRNPEAQLARTYEFLGLDEGFVPSAIREARSASRRELTLDAEVVGRLRDLYSQDVAALALRRPELDLSLWAHFSGAVLR